jgi:photosystem II stability/assembly factor-like uncharacterized protein
MKKIFTAFIASLFILVAINLKAQINQDWKWSHPFPQGNTLRWVKMMDANNWYACGYAGTFMKSSNAGTNWTIYTNAGGWQPSFYGQGRILYNGWFFNLNTGLVCGSSGWIARTTNGGVSWDSIASPTTNTLYGINFTNSTTGYIGGASGTVLKSTDAGLTWTTLTTGITTTIYNIFSGYSYVLAPTTVGNIRFSTDEGTTWNTSYTGTSFTVYDVNFVDANTGMACGSSGNIRFTSNAGLNWTSVNSTSTSTLYEIKSVQSSGYSQPYFEGFEHPTLFPPAGWTNYNVSGNVVWMRSYWFHSGAQSAICAFQNPGPGEDWLITPKWNIQSGDSLVFWMRAFLSGSSPDSLCVRVSATDSNISSFTTRIFYINQSSYPPIPNWQRFAISLNSYTGQGIFLAFKHGDNNGEGVLIDDVSIERYSTGSTDFYVAGDSYGIFKTSNNGVNWTQLTYNDPNALWTSTHYTLDVNGSNIFAGGAFGLIQKSVNAGTNFTCLTNLLSTGSKNDVWAQGNGKVIVVGAPSSAGVSFDQVSISTNGGTNWTSPGVTGSVSTYYSIAMLNASTGFIAGTLGSLRKTTNGGYNWDSVPGPWGTMNLRRIEFVNSTRGYLFQSSSNAGGAWTTNDGGNTWALLSIGSVDHRGYASSFLDANTGYVGNYVPKLMKTTDGGASWVQLDNTPMGSGYIYGVNFFDANTGYACGTAAGRLCRTTNGGTSFDTVPQPFASSLYTMKFFNYNTGWIFGSNGFAGKTTTGGTSWSLHNTGGSTENGCYFNNTDSGFVVGSSSYIHKIAKLLTSIEWKPEIPAAYYLKQNYPNPFNPTTTIEFALPKQGLVTLKIYDIAGREILNALNVTLNPGIIKYTFNGANFASGVYFYSLTVDGKLIDTKKMLLVK